MKGKEYMILTNEKHFFFDFSIIDKILEPPMSRIESVRKICYIQFAILANDFNKGFLPESTEIEMSLLLLVHI